MMRCTLCKRYIMPWHRSVQYGLFSEMWHIDCYTMVKIEGISKRLDEVWTTACKIAHTQGWRDTDEDEDEDDEDDA